MSSDLQEGLGLLTVDECEQHISLLLEYIYIGHLPRDVDCLTLAQLLRLGDYYQLQGLVDESASRMIPLVSESNILSVLSSLNVLSQASPQLEDILHSVIEEVRASP